MNADNLVRLFWGKAGRDRKRTDLLHPAVFHMIDVGMAAHELVLRSPRTALRGLSFASSHTDSKQAVEALARRVGFLVALHDLGKISPGFQKKRDDLIAPSRRRGFPFPTTALEEDHGRVTLSHLGYGTRPRSPAQFLARALAAHHGSFHAPDQLFRQREMDGTGPWWETRGAAIQAVADVFGVNATEALKLESFTAADAMVLAGLTAVSDWIGSTSDRDRETRDNLGFFPRVGPEPPRISEYGPRAQAQAQAAIQAIRWDPWLPDQERWTFRRLFPYIDQPNELQRQAEELASLLDDPCLIIVEAPMGLGKTEAGLYLADALLNRCGHVGLYDALPTQATSNQMFRRVKDGYLRHRLLGNPANLHLLHGLAAFDDDYGDLFEWEARQEYPQLGGQLPEAAEPTGIDGVDGAADRTAGGLEEPRSVRAASWFRGRKLGLLSPFAVGTIDQALMGALQVRHMFVRLYGLADKVIMIDEAHAYDLYMTSLMKVLLHWLGVLGSSVILMSATLPTAKRRELANAYAGREVEVETKPYPRITWVRRDDDRRAVVRQIESTPTKQVKLESLETPGGGSPHAAIAARLRDELEGGGCAAWICNTVASAQLAWLELEQYRQNDDPILRDCDVLLYHARFPIYQRLELEREVERRFGKEAEKRGMRPRRAVLFGTQVLEQALDYDVDVMVTELAPVDLVLQRSGRMHRHPNTRPPRLRDPRLFWMNPPHADSGKPQFGDDIWIYEPAVLLKTMLVLKQEAYVRLPGGIEDLVERVYGEGEIDLPAELNELARRLEERAALGEAKEIMLAGRNAIRLPDDPQDPFRMELLLPDDEAATDRQGRPGTRLAQPTVSIVCAVERDGTTLLAADDSPLIQNRVPDREQERRLLASSLRLQSRQWVNELLNEPVPRGWRESAVLREHRLVIFQPNGWATDGRGMMLHTQLGLITSRQVLDRLPI
jgi:CRISPR-associated endonuclease/helicase Cas3